MNITEIRVKLVASEAERLKAFCSVTLEGDFVIRDLKVIDGVSGLFVAMPSRKLCDRCPRCGAKNHLRARYCNECGLQLGEARAARDEMGRAKLHADIAHPINAACREKLQEAVIEAYRAESAKSRQPGYQPTAYDGDEEVELEEGGVERPQAEEEPAAPGEAEGGEGDEDEYSSLIAGLKKDARARQEERRRKDKGESLEAAGRGSSAAAGKRDMAQGQREGKEGGSALDDFLSKLGTSGSSGGGSRKRRSGQRGAGGPRKSEKAADRQAEPPAELPAEPPKPPAAPVQKPEAVPATQPQVSKVQKDEEEDDFGAGIL